MEYTPRGIWLERSYLNPLRAFDAERRTTGVHGL